MSSKRLFPKPNEASQPQSVPLSILDASCARFTPTGAIWIYDDGPGSGSGSGTNEALVQDLEASFVVTLADFPQWAGQLHWAPYDPQGDHTKRFNRLMVTFGAVDSDPGVDWTVTRLDRNAEDLVPDATVRASGRVWEANTFPQSELHNSGTQLALHDLETYQGLPVMSVQATLLKQGGFAISVRLAHALADAASLVAFMHRWAANNRRRSSSSSSSSLHQGAQEQTALDLPTPVFDPRLLDSRASRDIDSALPNPNIISIARKLPLHRYDWWATSAQGYPAPIIPIAENSKPRDPSLLKAALLDRTAIEIPWTTWNLFLPAKHAVVDFTALQVKTLCTMTRKTAPHTSRLDALLAHVWSAINRARNLAEDDDDVFLNLTLGLRAITIPPLPDIFIGSPVILGHAPSTGREASSPDPSKTALLASRIRSCIDSFTPEATAALLHDAAHETSPQRLWRAFLGQRHTLVTSWLRLGVNNVDFFGNDSHPRYVHPIMPNVDGCLQVMDSVLGDGGMDVSLYLESEAMARLLEDPWLHTKD